jgi:hypothetical protein
LIPDAADDDAEATLIAYFLLNQMLSLGNCKDQTNEEYQIE